MEKLKIELDGQEFIVESKGNLDVLTKLQEEREQKKADRYKQEQEQIESTSSSSKIIQFKSFGNNQFVKTFTTKILPISPPDIICAWIAGFFDAEGTFVIKGKFNAPNLALYNNDKSLLEYTQKHIGGRLSLVARVKRKEAFNDSYALEFTNHELVATVCTWLEPFLILKKRQAQIILESLKVGLKDRDAFKLQIQEVNKKGVSEDIVLPPKQVELSSVSAKDWAYISGYVDGDGWVIFQPQRMRGYEYWYPWVGLTFTKATALMYIYATFGGNLRSRDTGKLHWATKYEIVFQDQNYVRGILEGIIPYLASIKKEKAKIALESLNRPANMRLEYVEKLRALSQKVS